MQCCYNAVNFLIDIRKRQKTPHSSPVSARYGVSFVDPASGWYSAWVPVIIHVISCNIGPRYMHFMDMLVFWCKLQRNWHNININSGDGLTLNVRGPSYLGVTRSISWLLMPWLLTSPGHQQPWYWLCRICKSWSYLTKDFKYLCYVNVE